MGNVISHIQVDEEVVDTTKEVQLVVDQQIFKKVIKNRYLTNLIFSHVRGIHRNLVINSFLKPGHIDSYVQVYDYLGQSYCNKKVFPKVVKEKVKNAITQVQDNGQMKKKKKGSTIGLSFFSFYEKEMGPKALCEDPNIDLETFKQLIPLVRPRAINSRNTTILHWANISGNMERVKYLEEQGYKANLCPPNYKPVPSINVDETFTSYDSIKYDLTWLGDEKRFTKILDRLKNVLFKSIYPKPLLGADNLFQERLKDMFYQYNLYRVSQNLDQIIVPTADLSTTTLFNKKELNLIFTLLVVLLIDQTVNYPTTQLTIKMLILANNPIITNYFMVMGPFRHLPQGWTRDTKITAMLVDYCSLVSPEAYATAVDRLWANETPQVIEMNLTRAVHHAMLNNQLTTFRNILQSGKFEISSIGTVNLCPQYFDEYFNIALEFFTDPKYNENANQKFWTEIYKLAAYTSRNHILDPFFSNESVDQSSILFDPLHIFVLLEQSINGANYSLAMKIKDSPLMNQLQAMECISKFAQNIPTLCANRISNAVDFIITWEGGITLSTWKQTISKSIQLQRLDVLLKLVDVGIVSQNNPINIGCIIIRHTGFILECLEELPSNCIGSEITLKKWRKLIRKARSSNCLNLIAIVLERYLELCITEQKYKDQINRFLSQNIASANQNK
ncbi:hypothetical protein DFA_12301 [Cavenderia fasciculata]|uniref:Ankyrin repeat-containing protein n=1 Tax=Cavenderia fasciculata TaxID=261658 RepID=F4QD54_CACFS|nr:uncharacterized protein DFA_12301 [Cavenderia fasciculata]EGG14525.1 hypothetical protein DFA_12301 [Cavenderia fasciculata]|eukprot:XP_004353953.1 hypothetical protein DFA_12301 [Cavenderia fasciculata]